MAILPAMKSLDGKNSQAVTASGLEGVEVAQTALSLVDGERGELIIAGHDVEDLAVRSSFEDVCVLLWDGCLPDVDSSGRLGSSLGSARVQAFNEIPRLVSAFDTSDAMDAVRAAVAQLRVKQGERDGMVLVTAAMAVFAAAWARVRAGLPPLV